VVSSGADVSRAAVKAVLDERRAVSQALIDASRRVLTDRTLDGSFIARTITLPSSAELVDAMFAERKAGVDPVLVFEVRRYICSRLAMELRCEFEAAINFATAEIQKLETSHGGFSPDFAFASLRALRNKSIAYLTLLNESNEISSALNHFQGASNMTDRIAALGALIELPLATPARQQALEEFRTLFQHEPLAMLKWLSVQASASDENTTATVRALMAHSAFSLRNPNACYSLFGAFAANAFPAFHAKDGSGYAFLADTVLELDQINPQVAARIVSPFSQFAQYNNSRQTIMLEQLKRMTQCELSDNVRELVGRSLQQAESKTGNSQQ
jgi:aminopeptidase N